VNSKAMIYPLLSVLIFSLLSTATFGDQPISDLDAIVQRPGKTVNQALQNHRVKIAFATPLKQISDYWRRSIDSFKGRMDEIGLKYEITEYSTRSDEGRKLQECIRQAMAKKPDYLVLTLNAPDDLAVVSRLLVNSDVKVIVQNIVTPVEEWEAAPPFMYVGFDHTVGASLIAAEYKARFKNKQNIRYAMLYYIRGSKVSELRGDYFNDLVAEDAFKPVAEYYTDGNRKKAKAATLKILEKHSDLSFIHACSTDVAFGALDALKERGMTGRIAVNGWGGGAAELESIFSGKLDFTVMRMNDDNGVAMAEAIRIDLERGPEKLPVIYSGKMVIVRQGISKKDLRKLEQKAFRYSGND